MAKSTKLKLPKRVAGLKVPKALRSPAALETLVSSQAGRQLLADALMAAAAAAAAELTKERSAGTIGSAGFKRRGGSMAPVAGVAEAVAGLITDAAQSMVGGAVPEGGTEPKARKSRKAKAKSPPAEPRLDLEPREADDESPGAAGENAA